VQPNDKAGQTRKKIEIDELDLDKETIQELTEAESGQVQGGRRRAGDITIPPCISGLQCGQSLLRSC
jgi:hypothetical protein